MDIIKDLIPLLPEILLVFIPGLIFLQVYNWLNSKRITMGLLILWSLVIGYIINLFCNILISSFISNEAIKAIVYYIVALILSICCDRIVNSKKFGKLLHNYNNKVIYHDIFDYMLDYKLGTTLEVRLKNCPYYYLGVFAYREEKGKDSWIGLKCCDKLECKTDHILEYFKDDEGASVVLVKLEDIESIKIIYEDESENRKRMGI